MRVLVVGSGGREHALAWKLAQSPSSTSSTPHPETRASPRSGRATPCARRTRRACSSSRGRSTSTSSWSAPRRRSSPGVADGSALAGISVFGPSAAAARIEGSKASRRRYGGCRRADGRDACASPKAPCVVKVDGLAAGKGVFVCSTQEELEAALRAAKPSAAPVVVEELLEGEELSVFALCDGSRALPLGAARDYKRVGDGDAGPNTGGMGAYSPVAGFDAAEVAELVEPIHVPVLEQLARRGAPFIGLLFAGLMLTEPTGRCSSSTAASAIPRRRRSCRSRGRPPPRARRRRRRRLAGVRRRRCRAARPSPSSSRRASYPASGDAGSPIDGDRSRGGDRRARLPRRHGAARRRAGHERRADPRRDRVGGDARARASRPTRRVERISFPGARYRRRHRPWLMLPLVGILIGSESDRERMQPALDELAARGIACELEVRSAHRQPDAVAEYARSARGRGMRVLIAGAGLAAALPGVVAAHTDLPVIGVPLRSSMSVARRARRAALDRPDAARRPGRVRRRRQRKERRRAGRADPRRLSAAPVAGRRREAADTGSAGPVPSPHPPGE